MPRVRMFPHDVFAEVLVHLDDHRARHAASRHDQVIAFHPFFNAAEQPRDVPELLPRNAFHASAISAAAWYAGIVT